MTMHTYKVFLTHDVERPDPAAAAIAMHNHLHEVMTTMGVGDERRPVYRVEQFVDTGVSPKVCYVDSLTWRVYADEGCTVAIDEDWFNGKVYNAMSPTSRMVSTIEVYYEEMREAIELLANADDAELYPIDDSRTVYWADVGMFRDVLENGVADDGVSQFAVGALLTALAHVEERGAEEVHFHIQ